MPNNDFKNADLQDYIQKVQEAFDRHCDEIDQETSQKLSAVEGDADAEKKILDDQQAELDKTLAELQELLTRKTRQYREDVEKAEQEEMEDEFDLDDQLNEV